MPRSILLRLGCPACIRDWYTASFAELPEIMLIRSEQPQDIEAIAAVHRLAFAGLPYSAQTEHKIVAALRHAGDLFLSLVAEENDQILGHIAFAPVRIAGKTCRWVGLGPLGVLPEYRGRRLGSALIEHGLQRLQQEGIEGVVLLGDPDYYQRFGFFADPTLTLAGAPAPFFLALPFSTSGEPRGEVTYPAAYAIE